MTTEGKGHNKTIEQHKGQDDRDEQDSLDGKKRPNVI